VQRGDSIWKVKKKIFSLIFLLFLYIEKISMIKINKALKKVRAPIVKFYKEYGSMRNLK